MKKSLTGMWFALSLFVALAMPAKAFTNLLTNPAFDDGGGSFTGWTTFGKAFLSTAATDNIFRSGTAAGKTFGSGPFCPFPNFNVSGLYQVFTPSPGEVFQFSGYSFIPASADSMRGRNTCGKSRAIAKLAFFDAATGGNELCSNEALIGSGNLPRGEWLPFQVSAKAPGGALRVEVLILFLQPGCDAGAVMVDDLELIKYPSPSAMPNLLNNGSISGPSAAPPNAVPGWTTYGNVYLDTRNFGQVSPGGAAKLFGTFNPGFDTGMYQSFPTTAGNTYQFDVNALSTCQDSPLYPWAANGTDNLLKARIAFFDATDTEIPGSGNEIVVRDLNSPLGTWVARSLTATAPSGAATVRPFLVFVQPSNGGGAVFVDDLAFRNIASLDAPGRGPVTAVEMSAPRPNPLRGSTRIEYSLPRESSLHLTVVDVAGREVATLYNGERAAGAGSIEWNGLDRAGRRVAPGLYRVVLRAGAERVSRPVIVAE